jgi:hypothetical protein
MEAPVVRPARGPLALLEAAFVLVLLLILGLAFSPRLGADPDPAGSRPNVVSDEAFALVVEGRTTSQVEAELGAPARTVESLAEGYAWPEPMVVCWYYPAADLVREFQVCFIADQVVSHGSYVSG